jgi:signal transduction histidine kinase
VTRRGFSALEVAIVAAALLSVGLLVFSTRLTSTTLDRNADWNERLARIKLDVALSATWNARSSASPRAAADATAAARDCRALLGPVDGRDPRAAVGRLCSAVDRFRAETAAGARGAAYDKALARALRRGDEARQALALAIAQRRRTLNRIDAGIVLLVLLVFAGMAAIVARRAKLLAAHNERLERLDRLKDTFIAAVSHELRTPLMSALGALQTIEARELPDDQRSELLQIARVQTERLARLVDELLFFSEVESGRLRLSQTSVDLAAVAAESVAAQAAAAAEKGVELSLSAGEVPPFRADRGRVAQLLDHLVGNAVKFTDAGGTVEVRTSVVDSRAVVEVADTGAGIPEAEQADLFDRFFRSESAVTQAVPGAGIGLAIVRAIVDAHGGAVSVESAEGKGTTVRVELPLPRAAGADAKPRHGALPTTAGTTP